MSDEEWVGIQEAAVLLGCTASALRNGDVGGHLDRLPGARGGSLPGGVQVQTRFLRADIEELAEERRERKAGRPAKTGRYPY